MRAAVLVVGLGGALACGYKPLASSTPYAAQRIAVLPFLENDAVGVAPELADELSRLLAKGGATLTLDRQSADAVLVGTVTDATAAPTPGLGQFVNSYELSIEVSARLVRGETTLFATTLRLTDDFLTDRQGARESTLITEANRREAVRRLAARLAQELYDQLVMAALPG